MDILLNINYYNNSSQIYSSNKNFKYYLYRNYIQYNNHCRYIITLYLSISNKFQVESIQNKHYYIYKILINKLLNNTNLTCKFLESKK